MTIATPNVYTPIQVRALQSVFDQVWSEIGYTQALSEEALAKLIVALAADGGAEDRVEIDVEHMSREALVTVVRVLQNNALRNQTRLSTYSFLTRVNVSSGWAN